MLKLLLIIPLLGCLPLIMIKSEPKALMSNETQSQANSSLSPLGPLAAPSALKGGDAHAHNKTLMKSIALAASLLNLFLSIVI
jgi:hypothetical protein